MKKLTEKEQAIKFIAADYLGNKIDITDYQDKKILLSFFRGASCPFCNMRINYLIKNYSKFEKNGIVIITIFAASKDEILKYAGTQNAPFPIVADPDLELYKKYGIEESSSGMIKAMMNPIKMMKVMFSGFFNMKSLNDKPIIPADFLIDNNMSIYRAYYGNDFGDHIPIDEVLKWK